MLGRLVASRRIFLNILILACLLGLLRLLVEDAPFPVTWPIHFCFTLILTQLVYKNLLASTRTKPYILAMTALIIAYEIYWWFEGDKIMGSIAITALDSTMDILSGILGIILGTRINTWFS